MKKQLIGTICSSLLILLFVYNSLDKLWIEKIFREEINNQPLPNSWTPFIQIGLPVIECVIVVLLIFKRTERIGLIVSFSLLALFTGYIAAVLLHFFSYVPCSCAGVVRQMSWVQHLFFNLFFMGLALTGLILRRRRSMQPA